MTKKIITKEHDEIELEYLTLKELRELVDNYIERYGEEAKIIDDGYSRDDGDRVTRFIITTTREETDEEYEKRLETEKIMMKRSLERDLEQYRNLRKKLGINE